MSDPLSKAKLDEIERLGEDERSLLNRRGRTFADDVERSIIRGKLQKELDPATVLALVARARRADELLKRVAELEARVEYLS